MTSTAPLIAQILDWQDEFAAIRRDLHRHPELGFEEQRTSAIVAELLQGWGYQVHRNVGGTGVVGVLRQGQGLRSIGIRADMDALPLHDHSGLPHASKHPGKAHACGHDGHTATLLCAARYLAENRTFNGTLNLIFQPAEESLGGAPAMLADGLLERFPCDALYALHTMPGLALGAVGICEGAVSASSDRVVITLRGPGGHGAMPHKTPDPIVAAAALVTAFQAIVSRNVPAADVAVITVGALLAGEASNVIPDKAELRLTVRAKDEGVRALLEKRIHEVARGIAAVHQLDVDIAYQPMAPVMINTPAETQLFQQVATQLLGQANVYTRASSNYLGSEDFAWVLRQRPGCYIALGNGSDEAHGRPIHHPGFDFNDAAIGYGASLWVRLVQAWLI